MELIYQLIEPFGKFMVPLNPPPPLYAKIVLLERASRWCSSISVASLFFKV